MRYVGLWFSFLVMSLPGIDSRVMLATQNVLETIPSSSIFWKSLCRIGIISSINIYYSLLVKSSEPLWQVFQTIDAISLIDTKLRLFRVLVEIASPHSEGTTQISFLSLLPFPHPLLMGAELVSGAHRGYCSILVTDGGGFESVYVHVGM